MKSMKKLYDNYVIILSNNVTDVENAVPKFSQTFKNQPVNAKKQIAGKILLSN